MRNDERLRTIYEVMAPYIVRNEHNWRDYLAFASQFHKHSFDNILLVYAQDEDVSILATRKQWAAIGRNLIPRAKGVAVCVYRNAKLTLDYLFDVSQTTGKEMRKAIRRGDLFYADLNPVVGSEQGGIRPVLVIQNDVGNHFSPTVVAAAITSRKAKNSLPTHILLENVPGLAPTSLLLLEQLRTIDRKRLRGYIGRISKEKMLEVDAALAISIGIGYPNERRTHNV